MNLFFPFMMTTRLLDWSTAEAYTRELHSDPDSRLHLCPLDVIELTCPYLHTHVVGSEPRYDDKLHGRYVYRNSVGYNVLEYMFDQIVFIFTWRADGGMHYYGEYCAGYVVLTIAWFDGGVCVYAKGSHATYAALPEEYRYVWELMTRVVIDT